MAAGGKPHVGREVLFHRKDKMTTRQERDHQTMQEIGKNIEKIVNISKQNDLKTNTLREDGPEAMIHLTIPYKSGTIYMSHNPRSFAAHYTDSEGQKYELTLKKI